MKDAKDLKIEALEMTIDVLTERLKGLQRENIRLRLDGCEAEPSYPIEGTPERVERRTRIRRASEAAYGYTGRRVEDSPDYRGRRLND